MIGIAEKREKTSRIPRETTVEPEGSERVERRGLVGELRQYRIRSNGKDAVVRGGSVTGPGWFLFPMFGCFPNGGSWDCEGRWATETRFSIGPVEGEGSDADVIAHALGLERSDIRNRFPDIQICREPEPRIFQSRRRGRGVSAAHRC